MKNNRILDASDFFYECHRGKLENLREQHTHPHFELYFLAQGSCKYLIANRSYEVKEGDVIIIPEGVVHMTLYADDYRERHLINCLPHYIPGSVRELLEKQPPVYRNPSLTPKIVQIFKAIEEEYTKQDEFSADMLKCYVRELVILLARSSNEFDDKVHKSPCVAMTLNYIKIHFNEKISLPQMAELSGVSVAYLSRRFKQETGLGFSDYLSSFRLQKAERMLKDNPEMSIIEIAFSCGFNDSNYFSDKFKREYGISPLKFKKKA